MNSKKFYDSSNSYLVSFHSIETLTADRIVKLPDASGTVALISSTAQSFTGDVNVGGDLAVTGATTLNGMLTLGDAAADALSIKAIATYDEPIIYSLSAAISAGAIQTQTGATALTEELNNVTTCTTAGDGVKLPTAVTGKKITVKNSGAAILAIYPETDDSIDALAVNLAIRIQPGSVATFIAKSAVVWESDIDTSFTLSAPTTGKGQLEIKATDSSGDTVTRVTNASQAASRIYTIPDAGADAGFVMSEGTQTINGAKTFTGVTAVKQAALGSAGAGTVAVVEHGDGRDVTTVLTLTNFIVGALDGAAAAKGIGNIVYAFPAGQHFELVSALNSIVLTAVGTAVSTDTGLGSVIASGIISVLSGTTTFEDRLTGQTISTAAGGGAAASALTAATAGIGTGISLNIAASVKDVFLNSAGTWNADNTGNLTASGTIVLKWTKM